MKINKFGLTVLLCSTVYGFNAMSFETAARNAILMDYDTGEYLFTKNMDESVHALLSPFFSLFPTFSQS